MSILRYPLCFLVYTVVNAVLKVINYTALGREVSTYPVGMYEPGYPDVPERISMGLAWDLSGELVCQPRNLKEE